MPGIDFQHLVGAERVLHDLAIQADERHARPGQALHDKALAAEEARAELLAELDIQPDGLFSAQKGLLLGDHLLSRPEVDRHNLARRVRSKSDNALAALAGVLDQEQRLARDRPLKHAAQPAAAAAGLHADISAHPGHTAAFRIDRLTWIQ